MIKFPNKIVARYFVLFSLLFATSCASTALAYHSSEGLGRRVIAGYPEETVVASSLLLPRADDAVLENEALKELEQAAIDEAAEELHLTTVDDIERPEEVRVDNSSSTSSVATNQGNQAGSSVMVLPATPPSRPSTPATSTVPTPSTPATSTVPTPVNPTITPSVSPVTIVPMAIISPPDSLSDETISTESVTDIETKQLDAIIIDTVKGQEFFISLEGDGWFPQTSRIDPAFTFLGKDFGRQERSVFRFKLNQVGQFIINFNRNSPNGLEVQAVRINVSDPLKTPVDPPLRDLTPVPLASPSLEDSLALVAPSMPLELNDEASSSINGKLDEQELKKLFDELLAGRGQEDVADTMLNQFIERFPRSSLLPKMIYDLALAYEQGGAMRNIERSYDYYKKVYDHYPISPYSRMSKERLDYLDRFYFKIS